MSDMQAGIGPFFGVFLLAQGWESGLIGTVMTVGGIAVAAINSARTSSAAHGDDRMAIPVTSAGIPDGSGGP